MKQVIKISLCEMAFELEQDGYSALGAYLDQAKSRLRANPDQAEVVADLERSIAEKMAALTASHKAPLSREKVVAILQEVGAVEPGDLERLTTNIEPTPKKRQLYRIKERQHIAGVCAGLAEYSDLDVTMVRFIFLALTGVTGGVFALVYIVMMFIVPTAEASAVPKEVPLQPRKSPSSPIVFPTMGVPPHRGGK